MREVGTVKWWNDAKGYGFVARDRGADVFVHHASLIMEGFKTLSEGQRVSFEVVEGPKGLQARNVVPLTGEVQSESDVATVLAKWSRAEPVAEDLGIADSDKIDENEQKPVGVSEVSPPAIFVAWDPEVLDKEEYVQLVTALGDLVRAEGGIGIERLNSEAVEVLSKAGVFV